MRGELWGLCIGTWLGMTAIASLSIFKFLKHLHRYLILLPKSSETDEDNEGPLTGLVLYRFYVTQRKV